MLGLGCGKKLALITCKQYEDDKVVVPTNVLTTADVDNHDVKKSCNFSWDEFHGTSITMTNHLSHDDMGDERFPITFDDGIDMTAQVVLPNHYGVVHPGFW